MGDDSRVFVDVPEALAQELTHHCVVLDPELGRNAVVQDLPDLGMVEVILRPRGVDQVVHLLQELEGLEEGHSLDLEPAQDGPGVEHVPFDGAELQDLPLAGAQPAQAARDHVEHLLGDRDPLDGRAERPLAVALLEDLLPREELQDLHHEEGIPLGLPVEEVREVIAPGVDREEPLEERRRQDDAENVCDPGDDAEEVRSRRRQSPPTHRWERSSPSSAPREARRATRAWSRPAWVDLPTRR